MPTSDWIKINGIYRMFDGWQDGYEAFIYSIKEKEILIQYVKKKNIIKKRLLRKSLGGY